MMIITEPFFSLFFPSQKTCCIHSNNFPVYLIAIFLFHKLLIIFVIHVENIHLNIIKLLFTVNVLLCSVPFFCLFFFSHVIFINQQIKQIFVCFKTHAIAELPMCIYEDSLVRKANSFGNYRCSDHEGRNNKNNNRYGCKHIS